ncbi:hypothetical protein B5C26_05515 [Photorhabdus luminescens]|nr:hypothetical protein B5C26_05515 [Photorhabdus luminescens]
MLSRVDILQVSDIG